MVGVGSLNDGSQSAVCPLALEDEFRKVMKIPVIKEKKLTLADDTGTENSW